MKRYLVTGCYGFLGAQVSLALLQAGHIVIGVDRLNGANSKKEHRVQPLKSHKRFRFVEIDLADDRKVARLFRLHRPDEVMHFAAQYAVLHTPKSVKSYGLNNCLAPLWLLEEARLAGHTRFTYASSTFVQDGELPRSLYGATKHFAELAAAVYAQSHDMATLGIRYGSTFGPQCRSDVGVYQLAKKLLNDKPIRVGNAFHYRTAFLDVRDAVAATLALLRTELPPAPHAVTVVANDHRRDIGEILRMLEAAIGKRAVCDWEGYEQKELGDIPGHKVAQLADLCGYIPRYSIPQAIEHFAAWAVQEHAKGEL